MLPSSHLLITAAQNQDSESLSSYTHNLDDLPRPANPV